VIVNSKVCFFLSISGFPFTQLLRRARLTSQNPHVDKKADVNIKDDDGVSE